MPTEPLSEEQQEIRGLIRELARERIAPRAAEIDKSAEFPWDVVEVFREHGIFGVLHDEEYGGLGASALMTLVAIEEVSKVCATSGLIIAVQELGSLGIKLAGTDEQKQRFLPKLASGEWLGAYALTEPGSGSDSAAMRSEARLDGDEYVVNGRKYWPCNVGGWDNQGADLNLVVVRTDTHSGGTSGLSALIVERGTPGITYNSISTSGQRLAPNCEMIFDNARVPAANFLEGTRGNGDLLINRNFAWSGPVAGIAAVGVARAAYEDALDWAKTYTAGGANPIINFQYPGYVLGDVAAKIEAARYFCWKGAHYIDQHDYHGEMIGAMNKVLCTEMMLDCVYKCMQVVGVNAVDKKHMFERYLREASILPLYDGGNFGMQRRRVHGVMADPSFNPRAIVDNDAIEFTKAMEGIDTVPGHMAD